MMMQWAGHLRLQREVLSPSAERELGACGWQFVQIERGLGYWLGSPAPCALRAGDMIILFPENRGRLRASQIEGVAWRGFQFCPGLVTGLLTLAERHQLELFLTGIRPLPQVLPASHPHARQFAALADEAAGENSLLQRCRMLELAVATLGSVLAPEWVGAARTASAGSRFRILISQMTDSELGRYTARELAALCGCTPRHLSRLFRQYFGVSMRLSRRSGRLRLPATPASCPDCVREPETVPALPATLRKSNPTAIAPSPGVCIVGSTECDGTPMHKHD